MSKAFSEEVCLKEGCEAGKQIYTVYIATGNSKHGGQPPNRARDLQVEKDGVREGVAKLGLSWGS